MLQLNLPTVLTTDRQYRTAVDLSDFLGVDTTGKSGYTIVTRLGAAKNIEGGSSIRVVLTSPLNASGSLSAIYIGEAATTGNAYNFATTPTQLTFGGKTSLTLTAKHVYTSDTVTFDYNPSKVHLIAMNVSSSSLRRFTDPSDKLNVTSYYKAATTEAGTASKASGYTAEKRTSYCLTQIHALRALNTEPL